MSLKQSRRAFVVHAALASMALALLPHCKKKPTGPDEEKKEVIIIGAGIAGLAAAVSLKNAGHKVTIVEASGRYGGRIKTVDMQGYKADFGASWIHGINGNPLYNLANANAIPTVATHYDPSYIFDIDGTEITLDEWLKAEDLLTKLVDLAYDNKDISLEALLDLMVEDISSLSEKLQRVFYGAVRSEIELPYAVDAKDISARALTTNDSFPGNDVVFPGGMGALCDVLAEDLGIRSLYSAGFTRDTTQNLPKIYFNTFATKISYDADKVFVYTNSTSNIDPKRSCVACHAGENASTLDSLQVLSADKVIVAVPLGILKNQNIVFEPALTSDKINAINSLGIGTMNKVFLRFSENFWNSDGYFFQYLKQDHSKIIEFFSPTPTGMSNVIVAVFAGSQAKSIENMDEADLQDLVMNDLKGMFGENIPRPMEMQKTSWHINRFSLGSYPHLKPGATLSACDTIARPLNNKVFFAGDACSSKYMATAHGAYISGVTAANKAGS